MTRQNAPGVGRADRLALVEDGRAAGEQRRVDDVGVADDPADVGGGPVHLARARRRRCSSCSSSGRPRGRRCRARRPSACPSCRTCRGCRADRWRRPGRSRPASRLPRGRPSPDRAPGPAAPAPAAAAGSTQRSGLCVGELDGLVEQRLVRDRRGRPRCRTRRRRSASAWRRRCGSASSLAAKPPNTTEWMAPMRAQASIAMTASGTIGM